MPPAPIKTPILIVGASSAGLCAAAWLSRLHIPCVILEARAGPLTLGQADGVQVRTVEVFESFGLSGPLLDEAYHVLEVGFWGSCDADGDSLAENGGEKGLEKGRRRLVRTSRTADTMPGLSHMPHVILNQARVNRLLIGAMEAWNGQGVEYGYVVTDVRVDSAAAAGDADAYPVRVTAEKDGVEEVFAAKYVLVSTVCPPKPCNVPLMNEQGCDGAHSTVRRALGFKMVGDSSDAVWGVMDVYPRTNFPDIRKKATLHSDAGNMLIIPREGGSMVRFYIELPAGTAAKDVKLADLHRTARRIFQQYTLDIAETFWWSAYSIGQRLADHFSKDNRVFLTGDACHTHSPKAGQGMNTSLQDGYNMGWKLAAVSKGQASPDLLKTYNIEREKVAADLIDFDRYFSKLFAMKVKNDGSVSPSHFSEQFIKTGRYTAGLTATYDDSSTTSASKSKQNLAKGIVVGMRFPSAQVVRFCDAKAMQLVRALPADGRWRIVIFAGEIGSPESARTLERLANFLASELSPVHKFTPKGADIDSFIEPIVVLHGERIHMEQEQIPEYFCPVTGQWKMRDLHKLFIDDSSYNSGHGRAYEKYGVDVNQGAVAIVRPDHYVSMVTGLGDYESIGGFFDGFALPQR